jgi:hypothetical protein
MSRLRCARLLAVSIVCIVPLGTLAVSCTGSSQTSTVGQRISCTVTGTGVKDCRPMVSTGSGAGSGSGSNTCEDIDEDGDGSPHDVGEDRHDAITGHAMGGPVGGAHDDDDHDGIENDRDCDKAKGGDDDGEDHDGEDHDCEHHDGDDDDHDDDGKGCGSGSGSGSGHI